MQPFGFSKQLRILNLPIARRRSLSGKYRILFEFHFKKRLYVLHCFTTIIVIIISVRVIIIVISVIIIMFIIIISVINVIISVIGPYSQTMFKINAD